MKSFIFKPWPGEIGLLIQRLSVELLLLVGDGWRIPPFLPSTGQIPPQLDVC